MDGSGIGYLTGRVERVEHAAIMKQWTDRCAKGIPGMRTLGSEFATAKRKGSAK